MAAALEEALADPARLKAMGERGRDHVLETFTTQQTVEKEFSAYLRLIAEPKA